MSHNAVVEYVNHFTDITVTVTIALIGAIPCLFHGIALLIYLIAGPTTPAGVPPYSQYVQRSGLPPQPPQDYPRL